MSFDDLARVEIQVVETRLSELIGRVENGEKIVICRAGKPAAMPAPVTGEVGPGRPEEISAEA
jgi:antitoxin (DNA-binding transcriptional repressor) of toxin-antitoxin stability system